jgi:hypothetical protein
VIVDDEKVKCEENIWVITQGHNVPSHPWVASKTQQRPRRRRLAARFRVFLGHIQGKLE